MKHQQTLKLTNLWRNGNAKPTPEAIDVPIKRRAPMKWAVAQFDSAMKGELQDWIWGWTLSGVPVTPLDLTQEIRLFHFYVVQIRSELVQIGDQGMFWPCRILCSAFWLQRHERIRLSLLRNSLKQSNQMAIEAISEVEKIIPERLLNSSPDLPDQVTFL